MNRKDYFKDKAIVFIMFPIMGMISLFTMDDAATSWKVIIPAFMFGMPIGVALYGLIKYKK